MPTFKSSSAHRAFSFAMKIEKIRLDISKVKKIEEVEKLAYLSRAINDQLDGLFETTKEIERLLKKEKKEMINE